jgi:hypothetical protein
MIIDNAGLHTTRNKDCSGSMCCSLTNTDIHTQRDRERSVNHEVLNYGLTIMTYHKFVSCCRRDTIGIVGVGVAQLVVDFT